MVLAFDNDTASNPGSYTVVQEYSNVKYHSLVDLKVREYTWWRPVRGAETAINWIDVANPSGSLGSVRLYASGLSATTTYFRYAVEYYVEFRGRR